MEGSKFSDCEIRLGHWNDTHLNGAIKFIPPRIKNEHPDYIPGFSVRSSKRWFANEDWSSREKRPYPMAFISKSGKISMSHCATWVAHPEQVLATYTSTIYLRLRRIIVRRHGLKEFKRISGVCFRAASLHAITHDNWIIDRFLGILRKKSGKKAIASILHLVMCNLGDNERFVYNQICHQILWLTFRSERPRDKPNKEVPRFIPPIPKRKRKGKQGSDCMYPAFAEAPKVWNLVDWRNAYRYEFGSESSHSGYCSPCLDDSPFSLETPIEDDW